MTDPISVAILGFSSFERNAIVSYFNLGSRRTSPFQVVADPEAARLLVADADSTSVVTLLRVLERSSDAVFVGTHGPADAGAWLMRPVNPANVMRELDALAAQREHPESEPLPLSLPSPLTTGRPTLGDSVHSRRAADMEDLAFAYQHRRDIAQARRRQRSAAMRPQLLRRALLVDDSEIALHFLRRQLEVYGLDTDFARDSDRALELLRERPYGLVFIDLDLGEASRMDGLTLCSQLRHRPGLNGQPPLVVMVSAFNDPVDQVRGTLAGADAYLGKPLDFGMLDRLLQRQGFTRLGGLPPPGGTVGASPLA